MKYVGAHVSSSGGVENAPLNAAKINARAFALFTKNQRRWQSPPLTPESINMALAETGGVCAVIENTAGQGTNMGFAFEHLAAIIDLVTDKGRVGICLDTCHTFAAGYDIRTPDSFENVMQDFDDIVAIGDNIPLILETPGQRPLGRGDSTALQPLTYAIAGFLL